jgi:hypothetical protein
MAWWGTPHPQADEHRTTSMPLLPVDPDHEPEEEEENGICGGRFPQWERDADGWPIIPPKRDDDGPLIWK